MRLLVTRPKEDSEGLVQALDQMGVASRVEPLLNIEVDAKAKVTLDGVQALLITSANGVRAFAEVEKNRQIGVLAVGDSSARAAREAGFKAVESASGDVEALADLVKQRLKPEDGALLHVAGSRVAGDLGGLLEGAGYTYKRAVLYHASKAESLTQETKKAIRNGELDGVVFFSPRTAESFVSLARKARLQKSCREMTVYCLSRAVAEKASALNWKTVETAEKPEQDALLDRVRKAFEDRRMVKGEDMTTSKNDPKNKEAEKTTAQAPEKPSQTPSDKNAPPQPAEKKDTVKAETKKPEDNKTGAAKTAGQKPDDKKPGAKAATPSASTRQMPKTSSGLIGFVWLVAILAVIGGAAYATLPLWTPKVAPHLPEPVLKALGIAKPIAEPAAKSEPTKPVPSMQELTAEREKIKPELEQLMTRVQTLEKALSDVKKMVSVVSAASSGGSSSDQLDALSQRLSKLESGSVTSDGAATETAVSALASRIAALEAKPLPEAPDLSPTIESLSDRLSALEKVKAAAQESVASAPGMILAVGQLRDAFRTQRPFVGALDGVKALAGDDADMQGAIAILDPFAAGGLPSLTTLRKQFDDLAPQILRAVVAPQGDSWVDKTVDRLASVVTVRKTDGDLAGETTPSIVAQAEAALAAGDLAGAVTALDGLKDGPAKAAAAWMEAAGTRLKAEEALDTLQMRAIKMMSSAEAQ